MTTTRTTMLQLGYLGLLPFLFSLVLISTERTLFNLSGQQFFIAYSAVILSFLSGVLWGNAIDHFYHRLKDEDGSPKSCSKNLLVKCQWENGHPFRSLGFSGPDSWQSLE